LIAQPIIPAPCCLLLQQKQNVFDRLREIVPLFRLAMAAQNPVKTLSPVAITIRSYYCPALIITGEKDINDFKEIANILYKNKSCP